MFFKDEYVQKIMQTTREAGEIIIKEYHKDTDFKLKADKTPVTQVDLMSHDIIVKTLKNITPNINILSEEEKLVPYDKRKHWEEYWLIDPLDGTRGFIDKTDDFCVCISYIKYGQTVFGLIYIPLSKTFYIANNKDTAFKVQNNKWKTIKVTKPSKPLRVIVGKHSTNSKKINQHLQDILGNNDYIITGISSAIKFCLIAEGKYDYYPGLGICSEWDTSAGSFILQSAGGYVIDYFGNSLTYNKSSDIISPIFFASGDFVLSCN